MSLPVKLRMKVGQKEVKRTLKVIENEKEAANRPEKGGSSEKRAKLKAGTKAPPPGDTTESEDGFELNAQENQEFTNEYETMDESYSVYCIILHIQFIQIVLVCR